MSITEKDNLIKEILERGVEQIYPNKEFLETRLKKGEQLTLYLGLDPTGPTLHIGHGIQLLKLRQFQKLGHKIILLIGDFTAQIGDPTDKLAARTQLTKEEVLQNAERYKEQASHFILFDGENPATLAYNSTWFENMGLNDIVRLSSLMTVDQMLKRDMFAKRMEEGKPIYIHEFLYPLFQGYDSVAMDVDGEVGGNDQTFNMLAGRTLMKQLKNKEKFVIAVKLLADAAGKKMGKTEGNAVSYTDTPEEMYGRVMSWADSMIVNAFEACTTMPMEDVAKIAKELESGANPRDIKMRLAREIIGLYHSQEDALRAEESFITAFGEGGMPESAPEIEVQKDIKLIDIVVDAGIVASKTDFKRLVQDGAVENIATGQKIEDPYETVSESVDLKVGKRRFIKIKVI